MTRRYRSFSRLDAAHDVVPADLKGFGLLLPRSVPALQMWILEADGDSELSKAEIKPVAKLADGTMRSASGHIWRPFERQ